MFRELEQTDLGLYIGLREGGELDLRVAAQAALSFDTFIRLLVEIIEPGTQVELSLIKGEVGSLNLISKIRASVSKKTLKTIALLAAGWIGGETLSYGFQEFMNYLTSNLTEAQILEIGDENLKRIAEECVKASRNSALAVAHQELTTKLQEDEDVTGVGITLPGEQKPRQIMSRRDFPFVNGRFATIEEFTENGEFRSIEWIGELVLTEPVLIDKPRKWRFLLGKSEISAAILDEAFRQRALQGKLGVPLSQGITISAKLKKTEERLAHDLWKPVKYEIIEVLSWQSNPTQPSLPLSDGEEEQGHQQDE